MYIFLYFLSLTHGTIHDSFLGSSELRNRKRIRKIGRHGTLKVTQSTTNSISLLLLLAYGGRVAPVVVHEVDQLEADVGGAAPMCGERERETNRHRP